MDGESCGTGVARRICFKVVVNAVETQLCARRAAGGPGAVLQLKFVPVTTTSSGFPPLPAFTLPGVTDAMVGCGPRIVNAKADETLAALLSPTVMADSTAVDKPVGGNIRGDRISNDRVGDNSG